MFKIVFYNSSTAKITLVLEAIQNLSQFQVLWTTDLRITSSANLTKLLQNVSFERSQRSFVLKRLVLYSRYFETILKIKAISMLVLVRKT